LNPLEGQDNIYWQETLAPVEKAKRYIMENLAARLTLAEVAGECGVSKYHFSRIFKAATGRSFSAYVNKMRIDMAKELLMRPELNITEVCYATGFNDLSYFDRVFRRHTGTSPSMYRKRLKTRTDRGGPPD